MKGERPYNRRTAAMLPFVRPGGEPNPNLAWDFSATREKLRRKKKLFVIKQTDRLPSTNARGRKIRRILIFDNHPDSLRLVFDRHPRGLDVDLPMPRRVSWLEVILVSVAAGAGLVGILWPLFEV
jgi:hypothetical protein